MNKLSSILVMSLLMLASFTAHAQEYPRGDVNQDGAVNISDVTRLIDNVMRGIEQGDVNLDGAVNISDVTCIISYIMKGYWPDDPVTGEHEWVDLGLPSGTLWATCNIGASSPEEYGDYFAWGEVTPKEVYDWSTYKWCNGTETTMTKYCINSELGIVDNKTELEPADDAAYVNWGPSWRMPTIDQLQELKNSCTWERVTISNGDVCILVTGTNGNTMLLPLAGSINGTTPERVGLYGYLWSSTASVYADESNTSQYIYFNSPYPHLWRRYRYFGFTVRAVRATQD